MKKLISRRSITGAACALAFYALSASAASNMYLQITNAEGESSTIACANDTCTADNLAAGKYQVVLCDANGSPVSSNATMMDSVTVPRAADSARTIGKRQHSPMTIIHHPDSRSLQVYELTIEEPGSSAKIKVTGWNLATNKKM